MVHTALKSIPARDSVKPKPAPRKLQPIQTFGPILAIAGFFVLATALISPAGNFPLNDDWMYSYAVKCFAETGKFVFVGPNCTACLVHIIVGAALCKAIGFSHESLRLLTIAFAFLNTLTVYWLARELNAPRRIATFFALTYASSPLFLNLAFSYMTDISSLLFTTLSTLFTVQGIKRNSAVRYVLAGLMLICAVGVRQTNACFIAANVCLLLYLWMRRKHSWTVLLALIVAPAIWFKMVDKIAPISTNHPMAYGWYQNHVNGVFHGLLRTPMNGIFDLSVHTGETAFYIGLLFVPVLVAFAACFADLFRQRVRVAGAWFVAAASIAVATLTKMVVQDQNYMPFSQNLLRVPILGSLGIMGINIATPKKPWRLALTHLSAVLGVLLIAVFGAALQRCVISLKRSIVRNWNAPQITTQERRTLAQAVCCASACAVLALVVVQSSINDLDRYYQIPCAVVIAFLAVAWRWLRIKPRWALTLPALALLATYSICAQQDYMSWNRARWDAARSLEAKGVPWQQIDGGAEYDFDHNHLLYNTHFRGAAPQNRWRYWSITGEQYIISFSPIPNYEQVGTQRYFSALCMRNRELLILKCVK